MTTQRIKLRDLDEQFIRQLKEEHPGDAVEIVFQVHERASNEDLLSEEEFWSILSKLDWDREDDEDIVEPVVAHLTSLSVAKIYQFQDKLSEKLYLLDTRAHAEHTGDNAFRSGEHFSVDLFLYDRCAVVANGREVFEQVLADPATFPQEVSFESLLYLATDAYERKTGNPIDYIPAFNYETFSNEEGWKNV